MFTKTDVAQWFEEGHTLWKNATHLIVLRDTAMPENVIDFPAYVFPGETLENRIAKYQKPGTGLTVVSVYDLANDFEEEFRKTLKVSADDVKPKLLDIWHMMPVPRRKLSRFAEALAEKLKPEITVDGFVWACEKALLDPENDFERIDRKTIRDELPAVARAIFANRLFLNEVLEELSAIARATHNLD